jgi:hypothetical protein
MPELLAHRELIFAGRFLTTGESLPLVDFSAALRWLELPVFWVGLSELLAFY